MTGLLRTVAPPSALGFVLALAACGPPQSPPQAPKASATEEQSVPTTTPEELTMGGGQLALAPLTLRQGGTPSLLLLADGTVKLPREGRILGKMSADGRFRDPSGNVLATLTQAGEVVLKNDEYLPVTIAKDGKLNLLKENRSIELAEDGSVKGGNPNAPSVTVDGVTPRTRRTAMFLLVLSAYPVRSRP